jgi:hypothetical protein
VEYILRESIKLEKKVIRIKIIKEGIIITFINKSRVEVDITIRANSLRLVYISNKRR